MRKICLNTLFILCGLVALSSFGAAQEKRDLDNEIQVLEKRLQVREEILGGAQSAEVRKAVVAQLLEDRKNLVWKLQLKVAEIEKLETLSVEDLSAEEKRLVATLPELRKKRDILKAALEASQSASSDKFVRISGLNSNLQDVSTLGGNTSDTENLRNPLTESPINGPSAETSRSNLEPESSSSRNSSGNSPITPQPQFTPPGASSDYQAALQQVSQSNQITTVNFGDLVNCLVIKYAPTSSNLEEVRLDKQVGGDSSLSGSTSLVQKGNIPSFFGFAVENGALTQSTSGTNITFRGNPIGIIKALSNKGFGQTYSENYSDPLLRHLGRLSFSVTFDASRGPSSKTQNPLQNSPLGDLQALSAFSVRYNFLDQRDPRNKRYAPIIYDLVIGRGKALLNKFGDLFVKLMDPYGNINDPKLEKWVNDTNNELRGISTPQERGKIIEKRLDLLVSLMPEILKSNSGLKVAFDAYQEEFERYTASTDEIMKYISKGWIGTFEYTNNRQVNAPNLSNFRVIIEKGMQGSRDFTFNGSATIYDKLPTGMNVSRLRDFQIAVQFDQQLGEIQGIGKPVLSFSYQFKRQPTDVMMEGAMGMMMMPQTNGNIHIGQFKVTFPAKGTGVKIPISVTFANRSELIKESFVRGNVGLTFDFNTLFAKFKP